MADKCILRVLSQDSDLNYNVEIAVLRSGKNRNNWDFQNVEMYANTFRGVPILCAYLSNGQVADGHNMSQKKLPGGEIVYDFTGPNHERIVGAIGNNEEDVRTEVRDGQVWVIAIGKLWRFYNWQLVDHIAEQGRMEVSAETEVIEEHNDNGVSVFTNWRALGVTILNEKVAPAIPGANIKALKELGKKFEEVRLAAASYHPNPEPKPDDKPKNNKKDVKKAMNYLSKKALPEIQELFGEGYAVLSAAQNEETTTVTVLRKSDYAFLCYELGTEKVINTDRLTVCAARLVLERGGEEVGCADACEVLEAEVGELCDNADAAKAEAKAASERADKAEATLKDMEARETARRIKESGLAAERQLSLINENRAENEKFGEDIIADIKACAEKGDYVNCTDADGDWCGDKNAMSAVRDLCMQKQMEMDKQKAEQIKASASRKYAFEPGDFKSVGGGIEALYNDVVKN